MRQRSKRMIKVRYHLQNGPNYMHWQFKEDGKVWYAEPSKNIIVLKNCVLHNNPKLAEKIYMGKNKDVCAWIKCKEFEVLPEFDGQVKNIVPSWCSHLRYNPKVLPYWHTVSGQNIDGFAFDKLYLCENGVFFDQCRKEIFNPLR